MIQFQVDDRAVKAGLLMPQSQQDAELRLTEAGLFFMLGALAHDENTDAEIRKHHLASLTRVLIAAKKGGLDDSDEALLLTFFTRGVDPLGSDDQGQLFSMLCRLVSLSVGRGRMGALIADEHTH